MKNIAEKILELGMGTVVFTQEKIEQAIRTLEKKGEIGKKEAEKLIEELTQKGKDIKKEFQQKVEEAVKNALKKMDIPTRKEVEEIKKELEELKKKIK